MRLEHLDRVERLFKDHGGRTIVAGRFVGVVRTLTPFVAGVCGLTLRRFLPYSVGGALAWAATFTLLGYVFSDSCTAAWDVVTRVTLGGVGLTVLVMRRRRPPARIDTTVPRPPLRRPTAA